MGLKIPVGQGAVILEIGRYLHNRSIVSSAVLRNGLGSQVHVWELDDGETLVLDQKPRQRGGHLPQELLPETATSSWSGWHSTKDPLDDVVQAKSSEGFSVKKYNSPDVPKHTQLQLADMRGVR